MAPTLELSVALEPPADDQEQDRPEKPVCANCRSADISFDASAYWDAKEQQFAYDILRNQVLCVNCNGRQDVDWIPV